MTYLEICKAVRILSGAQGVGPASVVESDLSGYEVNLVAFVDTTYVDIQSSRDNFKFMRADTQFSTVVDQESYTCTGLLPGVGASDIKDIQSIRIQDNGKWIYLCPLEYDEAEYRFLNTEESGKPTYFSRVPGDSNGDKIQLYPTPDAVYPAHIEYYRKPEVLEDNTDVPMLPEEFHLAIVYKAADRFASFLGSPEIDEEYKQAYKILSQKLYASQVPSRDMRPKNGRARRGFDI